MWQLNDNSASLTAGALSAVVKSDSQQPGLTDIRFGEGRLAFGVVQAVRLDTIAAANRFEIAETYVRGHDYVATYQCDSQQTLTPQIRWRIVPEEGIACFETIVSMQTSLLERTPTLDQLTKTTPEQLLLGRPLGEGTFDAIDFSKEVVLTESEEANGVLLLYRLAGSDVSYAEMLLPADFDFIRIDSNSPAKDISVTYRLFPESMEKGVIRRIRTRGVFVSRSSDERDAAQAFHSFLASPAPLTA